MKFLRRRRKRRSQSKRRLPSKKLQMPPFQTSSHFRTIRTIPHSKQSPDLRKRRSKERERIRWMTTPVVQTVMTSMRWRRKWPTKRKRSLSPRQEISPKLRLRKRSKLSWIRKNTLKRFCWRNRKSWQLRLRKRRSNHLWNKRKRRLPKF